MNDKLFLGPLVTNNDFSVYSTEYIDSISDNISGITNYIPLFSSSSSITNSTLQSSGGTIIFPAGTSTNAPLKLTSGELLTIPEQGAVEYITDNLYIDLTTPNPDDTFTSIYPPAHNSTYVKANNTTTYYAYNATDPSKLLTGPMLNNSWGYATYPVRFHIDLGSATTINRIYYENLYDSVTTNFINNGVRQFTFWGSNSTASFNDLTYANDSGWTQIHVYTLYNEATSLVTHINSNISDPHYLYVRGTPTTYRYYALKCANTYDVTIRDWVGLRRIELQQSLNTRKKIITTDGGSLSSSRIPVASVDGRLVNSNIYHINNYNGGGYTNKIGINQSNPYYDLEVSNDTGPSYIMCKTKTGTANAYIGITTSNGINYEGFIFYYDAAQTGNIYFDTMYGGGDTVFRTKYAGVLNTFVKHSHLGYIYHNFSTGIGVVPTAKLHIDAGTATASALKFTANATTGQLATDGFDIGIATDATAEIRQRENKDIVIYTNNTECARFIATGIEKLHVSGNTKIEGNLYVGLTTTGSTNLATFSGATGGLNIENTGFIKMIGNVKNWNDLIIPASNLRPGATPPTYTALIGGIFQPRFDNAVVDEVYGSFELPHDMEEGSLLDIHVHWCPDSTNSGTCTWGIEYSMASMNTGAFSATTTITSATANTSGVAYTHIYQDIARITIPSKVGDIIIFRLFRDGSADAFTGNAFLVSVGLHYISDTLGSRNELSK